MTEAEALRVLGLDATAGNDGPIDAEVVRSAFSVQMRMLRGARSEADTSRERQRIDRALALTLMARDRLLPADSRAFALTQEMARIERSKLSRYALAVLLIGVVMVAMWLFPEPAPTLLDAQELRLGSPPAEGNVRVSRELLEGVRLQVQAQWLQTPSTRLPRDTDFGSMALPRLPAGWRWQSQRDGAFAAIDSAGEDWLLAAPLLENGNLYWACLSARSGRAGCHLLAGDAILERRLPRGQVSARLLAEALARLPDSQRQDGWLPERWYRQALRQLEAGAFMPLADHEIATAQPVADAARDLNEAVGTLNA